MRLLSFFALPILTLVFGSQSFAAGYSCLSVDRDTIAVVYLDLPAGPGAISEAKQLVFIDPELSEGAQALASFSTDDQVLTTEAMPSGRRFVGKVDLDLASTKQSELRAGKRLDKHLGGTKVSLLDTVTLEIETVSVRHQVETFLEGTNYAAQVHYQKKSGQVLTQDFDCSLFLGGERPPEH